MTQKILLLPLIIMVLLVAGFALAVLKPKDATPFASRVGQPVSAQVIDGFDTAGWRGKNYVVNFFASWCLPCRAEHPQFKQLQQAGIPIIGIAYRDQPAATQKFLADYGNVYAQLAHDMTGRGGIEWGITGVPETYVIDRSGIIRWHHAGPVTAEMLENEMLPLLRALP